MSELERCLNVIEGLRRGTCWCGMGIGDPNYTRHTIVCMGAVELLERNGREVPSGAKS